MTSFIECNILSCILYCFIYSLSKYLLNVCHVSDTVPGTGDKRMTKSSQLPCSRGLYSLVGGKDNNQMNA